LEAPLIVVDVGNSRLKAGLFDRADSSPLPEPLEVHAQDVSDPLDTVRLLNWVEKIDRPVPSIATGSSPGGVETLHLDWSLSSIERPVPLSSRKLLNIEMNVEFPDRVGIDRLLAAIAANKLRTPDQAALIVDSGTATTINLVDEEGVFQGGAILPGLRLSAKALHEYTQLLPHVSLEELASQTRGPVGKETQEAIRSGLYWGQIGAIRELSQRMLQDHPQACRLLTGGGAELLSPELTEFELSPNLSLRGFALLADELLGE
jgi:type III pantothenate kinase